MSSGELEKHCAGLKTPYHAAEGVSQLVAPTLQREANDTATFGHC